jgi:hypothetical protein
MRGARVRPVVAIALVAVVLAGGCAGVIPLSRTTTAEGSAGFRAEFSASSYIYTNCTVSANSPFARTGAVFELERNYTGGVEDSCSGVGLDDPGNFHLTYGAGNTAALFLWKCANVTVRDFDILGSGNAMELDGVTNVTVDGGNLSTTGEAAFVLDSTGVVLVSVNAVATGGIQIDQSDSIAVEASDLAASSDVGVDAQGANGLSVTNSNLSADEGGGIVLSESSDASLQFNVIANEGKVAAISLDAVSDANVSENNLSTDSFGVVANDAGASDFWANAMSAGTYQPYAINNSFAVGVENVTVPAPGSAGVYLGDDDGVTLGAVDCGLAGFGVEIQGGSNIRVSDSNLSDAATGVLVTGAVNVSVIHSDLAGGNNGVWASSVSGLEVDDSNLSHANYPLNLSDADDNVLVEGSNLSAAQEDGAYLYNATNVTVEDSTIRGASNIGVVADDTEAVTVSDSNLAGAPGSVGPEALLAIGGRDTVLTGDDLNWTQTPVVVSNEQRVTLEDSTIQNASATAIALTTDQQVTLSNLDLANGSGAGISSDGVSELTLVRVNFDGIADDGIILDNGNVVAIDSSSFVGLGSAAVDATDTSDLIADNDTLENDAYAFVLMDEDSATVLDSTALNNSDGGLTATDLQGLTLTGDNFSAYPANDVTAVSVSASDSVVVADTTFAQDFEAVALGDSDATIQGSTFDRDNFSFSFDAASAGLVFHNDFVEDGGWMLAGTPTFAWNEPYPVGGNYWSNYTGSDRFSGPDQNIPGPDGIGDTPFVLAPSEVDYYPLMTPWVDHVVVFVESGLPSGTPWSVDLNGTSYTSDGASIVVYSAVGAFTEFIYSIAPVDGRFPTPSAGTGEFDNGTVLLTVQFRPPTYAQTFTVSGLPNNASWSVTVNGSRHSTEAPDSIVLDLANGTYDYTVGPTAGFLYSPIGGVLYVRGGSQTVALRASVFLFQVRFVETGLPLGLSWNLAVNGTTAYSSSDVDLFSLANGSYSFAVNASAGYAPTPAAGTFGVLGSDVDVVVHFAQPGSSPSPPPGGSGSSPTNPDYLPYEVAIGVAAGVGALGWALAAVYRRRGGFRPR